MKRYTVLLIIPVMITLSCASKPESPPSITMPLVEEVISEEKIAPVVVVTAPVPIAPAAPVIPTDPAVLADPVVPVAPVIPAAPIVPATPVIPTDPAVPTDPVVPTDLAEEPQFESANISQEEFDTTKADIQRLIETLNKVIQARDFNAWLSYLTDDYIAAINSKNYLARLSEISPLLKSQKIVLKTPEDYFTYVVVPSRINARVDDIEFDRYSHVKAFALRGKTRLRLFELEKFDNRWKIAFPD
jgi:hypothetical protein